MPKYKNNNVKKGWRKDAFEDDLHIRYGERLLCIVTTGINDSRNPEKKWQFEKIGYELSFWKKSADNLIRIVRNPKLAFVNGIQILNKFSKRNLSDKCFTWPTPCVKNEAIF